MIFVDQFKAAVRAATPLIAVTTMDQQATFRAIAAANPKRLIFTWDLLTGITALGPQAEAEKMRILKLMQTDKATLTQPKVMLEFASLLIDRSMLFLFNAQNYLPGSPPRISDGTLNFVQGLWNLREPNKEKSRTTVLLGPEIKLPPELVVDVLLLDEPLPTPAELEESVRETVNAWNESMKDKIAKLEPKTVVDVVDALRGIESRSASDQVVSMCLSASGIDIGEVWNRKRSRVNQAPGLLWYGGNDTLKNVCGYRTCTDWHLEYLQSKRKPTRCIIFQDEFEKAWAGSKGQSSSVDAELLGMVLTEMQENKYSGSIFVGPPGAGKSAVAKALGGEIGKPTIFFDLARMKEGIVGESTKNLSKAFKIIRAISDGNAYFIATSNGLSTIPAELLRRYKGGIWYFDLPTPDERDAIWELYYDQYEIPAKTPRPDDTDWTGSEIQKCCEMAWMMNKTPIQAAKSVIPVATSAKKQIEDLRDAANGTYLSATYEGEYQKDKVVATRVAKTSKSRQFAE